MQCGNELLSGHVRCYFEMAFYYLRVMTAQIEIVNVCVSKELLRNPFCGWWVVNIKMKTHICILIVNLN